MSETPHANEVPDGKVRCHAHSKRTGEQCSKYAIPGARVCYYHGGAAPQVKAKAMERIMAMVDPALHHLSILIEEADSDSVQLAAIRDLLDRAGLGAKQTQIHQVQGVDGKSLFPDLTQLRAAVSSMFGELSEQTRNEIAAKLMISSEAITE